MSTFPLTGGHRDTPNFFPGKRPAQTEGRWDTADLYPGKGPAPAPVVSRADYEIFAAGRLVDVPPDQVLPGYVVACDERCIGQIEGSCVDYASHLGALAAAVDALEGEEAPAQRSYLGGHYRDLRVCRVPYRPTIHPRQDSQALIAQRFHCYSRFVVGLLVLGSHNAGGARRTGATGPHVRICRRNVPDSDATHAGLWPRLGRRGVSAVRAKSAMPAPPFGTSAGVKLTVYWREQIRLARRGLLAES